MTATFRFLEWEVYRDAKNLLARILQIVRRLPPEYRFEIGSQIIRSALSIVLNIAEGSGKHSDRELNRFIEIALGSVNETLAATDILLDNQLITKEELKALYENLESIAKQLGGFKKKLAVSR